jgi:pimeloyl-ACP methyl ester carboxylesterase
MDLPLALSVMPNQANRISCRNLTDTFMEDENVDLYYEIQGQGEPIVLLHSGGADLRDWQFIAPQLAKKYRVLTFDGRGAGQSPPLLEPADYVADLKSLLDDLMIDQAVLIGHSIGGQIATDFALTYPSRVAKLVLVAPGLSGNRFSSEVEQWFGQIWSAAPNIEKMVELILAHPVYRVVMASPQSDLMTEMTRHNQQRSLEWKTFEMRWAQPPTIERLDEIQTKTLFIIGDQDMADNLHTAELFKQVPDIRFATITGADHMPTLTHSEEIVHLITNFLSK